MKQNKYSESQIAAALRQRLRELAQARPRLGYLRLHVLLRREGWRINKKRVHRLYREEGLTVRKLPLDRGSHQESVRAQSSP